MTLSRILNMMMTESGSGGAVLIDKIVGSTISTAAAPISGDQ